ncbi:hypothetical protein GYMLUDRAFT_42271 [Collybiopsis luxurians FD-317 M1]|uniref:Uncharacterized protein n=1 Tax=Collybiopsis luxurians FD-317 M1 TaxID=944289 RepID=A0A0D0BDP7_9AGAR|nr:hypothetical protein GYMLUDRAFT_42271 [Collybiopsis luxurians FD-317 M1]
MTRRPVSAASILSRTLLLCPIFFFEFPVTSAVGVNRSIDDTLGDSVTGQRPTYLPSTSGVWEDNTCSGCALAPPISSAFQDTYTAATYNPDLKNISISFDFTGTAIYIFLILANDPDPGISASTAVNITLDGKLTDTFTHTPNSSDRAFLFNESALAFSKTGMKNISHQMVISTSGLNSNYYLNFDYALYTFQGATTTTLSSSVSPTPSSSSSSLSSSSSSSSSTPIGAIVGGVVGGIATVAILAAGLFYCRRRHKRAEQYDREDILQREIDPFILPARPANSAFIDSHPNPTTSSAGPISTFPSSTFPSGSINPTATSSEAGASSIPLPADAKDMLRQQRQQELERQMQHIHDEIQYLQNEAAERNSGTIGSHLDTEVGAGAGTGVDSTSALSSQSSNAVSRGKSIRSTTGNRTEDVSQLKAQIRAMSEHIAYLQEQQNSAWAQGLSDEPPPGYTPTPEGPVVV